MRLGIDLDGVVADFNLGWMVQYNAEFGTDLEPDMVTTWGAMLNLTKFDTMSEFWKWARNDAGFGLFHNLPVYPDALEALARLAHTHKIVVITTKPYWAVPETYSWIANNQIPTREVHITHKKWEVDCDVYLDDGPHNLEALVEKQPDRIVCRFVQAWNDPVDGVTDINSWDEFERYINSLS